VSLTNSVLDIGLTQVPLVKPEHSMSSPNEVFNRHRAGFYVPVLSAKTRNDA
jgi:hypothetical protein